MLESNYSISPPLPAMTNWMFNLPSVVGDCGRNKANASPALKIQPPQAFFTTTTSCNNLDLKIRGKLGVQLVTGSRSKVYASACIQVMRWGMVVAVGMLEGSWWCSSVTVAVVAFWGYGGWWRMGIAAGGE
ncbi:hypothetical protein Acr_02g0012150 [Actinidia rufa]|uniref:Uncharacterized protein n=1 Tax=Actinidia rufa TaxID=165716 RepID=A0A7J0E9B9_9ERIC|nr:hypothetical protein Acr_02g0012150 [Actinidia rufa]